MGQAFRYILSYNRFNTATFLFLQEKEIVHSAANMNFRNILKFKRLHQQLGRNILFRLGDSLTNKCWLLLHSGKLWGFRCTIILHNRLRAGASFLSGDQITQNLHFKYLNTHLHYNITPIYITTLHPFAHICTHIYTYLHQYLKINFCPPGVPLCQCIFFFFINDFVSLRGLKEMKLEIAGQKIYFWFCTSRVSCSEPCCPESPQYVEREAGPDWVHCNYCWVV